MRLFDFENNSFDAILKGHRRQREETRARRASQVTLGFFATLIITGPTPALADATHILGLREKGVSRLYTREVPPRVAYAVAQRHASWHGFFGHAIA